MGHLDFLYEEFEDMINKGQWLILPASAVKEWPGLRYSPPGVVPQRGRRPRWIVDYSFWGINEETLPLAALESMRFGTALDRILREILLADPAFGPVYLMKVDLSDGLSYQPQHQRHPLSGDSILQDLPSPEHRATSYPFL